MPDARTDVSPEPARYSLYLESGPRRKKTMVHVFDLFGCIANGPTTEAALEATPDAIRSYLAFLHANGEDVDAAAPFETEVVEHVTEGEWLGNGSPYANFPPDLEPVTAEEIDLYLWRFHAMREALAAWGERRPDEELDAAPAGGGRTGRAVLLHVATGPGSYLATAIEGVTGFHRVQTALERGQMPIPEAIRKVEALATGYLRSTTPEQRAAVNQRPREIRTLRKAVRRMLEHDWEHLAELSRRDS
jgi:predicted RNase H-like HicB family nuclease